MPVMSRLTPTCEVITQKVSQSMDRPLSLNDRIRVRLHLLGCELCARYEKQLLAMRNMLNQLASDTCRMSTDVTLPEEKKEYLRQVLKQRSDSQ